ncbi:MAG: DNA-3-methyladenine glycosylase [Chloroflexi bacterium]|nr:DNA-3-methyladenine glycosylase [Chloroflexota bacterium]MDA1145105.1 DNA-3-methyladenine glycosylase [Chloroflexota bacterium]
MAERLRFSAAAAYRHLREADPVVGRLIDQHGPFTPRPTTDPYASLVRTILFQQLAGAAASAIQKRLYARFGDETRTPTPAELLATNDEDFRSVGVSRQKAGYLRDLAQHVAGGELDFDHIDDWPDAEVSAHLVAVKGIGEWSAHMFLMFQLGRPDVLPVGDLGVRIGMRVAYDLTATPTAKEALVIGEPWHPYASVASWYMWRAAETVTPD